MLQSPRLQPRQPVDGCPRLHRPRANQCPATGARRPGDIQVVLAGAFFMIQAGLNNALP